MYKMQSRRGESLPQTSTQIKEGIREMTDISTIMREAEGTRDGIGVTVADCHEAALVIDTLRRRLASIADHLADGLYCISASADKTSEALRTFHKAVDEVIK